MPDTLFITPGPISWASSRMRAHWVAEHMDADTMQINEIIQQNHISPAYNNYIFSKSFNNSIADILLERNMRLWWDICDPIHWFTPNEVRQFADRITGFVFSCDGLRDDFMAWYGETDKPVAVIPDRVKLSHFTPRETISTDKPLRFIWFGAGQNRHSVISSFAYLDRLYANGVECILTIFDDAGRQQVEMAKVPMQFINWDLRYESQVISSHDIAILPGYPGPWGKVKSNNKCVTAAACGVVPTHGEDWEELWTLATNPDVRRERTLIYLDTVRRDYNVEKSAQEWKELIDAQH